MKLRTVSSKKQMIVDKKDENHNQLWEWEETPELREFIRKYGKTN